MTQTWPNPFARAAGQPPGRARQRSYDYIVCGAGSSGSVVAGQLAANPDVTVLLLEAGGSDDVPAVLDPNQWLSTLGSGLDWGFTTAPNPHLNGRAIPYAMGRVLGGGGSINVGVWARGHQADWDLFAEAAGDPAWGYAAVRDVYRRVEDRADGPEPAHGGPGGPTAGPTGGRMWVQPAPRPHPFVTAALDAMSACGVSRFPEMNGALWEAPNGCAYVDEIVHGGRRQSPFRSYVWPRLGQPNLTVLTGAVVTRVRFEGNRAAGVEFVHDGRSVQADAALDVVLALGALQTPKVLLQSGVGDAAELKRFGIPLVQHLPAVGRHLHDHPSLGCVWEAPAADLPPEPRGQAVAFWQTDGALPAPNALAFAIPIVYATPENGARHRLPASGWSLFAGFTPEGRGALHLTGPGPADPLRIETDFLADPRDLETALAVVAMCRDIGNGAALRPFASREALPGDVGAADLERFVRDGVGTFWHQSGTARVGRDEASVVDAALRVHGVEGLRVADASVLPRATVGNTMAPCVVIGQRAADLLRAEYGH